jgi:hypothetical protein
MRCFSCEKKLKLSEEAIGKCKCDNIFCIKHRENHSCDYDYKLENTKNLSKSLIINIKPEKLEKL